jgi:hypothetical protein
MSPCNCPAALEIALKDAIDDWLGIYPLSVNGVPRDAWKDGWNAAVMQRTQQYNRVNEWYNKLLESHKKSLKYLLINDVITFNLEEPIVLFLNVNDAFGPGSDAEDVTLSSLPVLEHCYKKHGYDGLIAFVAIKRNMEPTRKDEEYLKAKEYLLSYFRMKKVKSI